MIEVEYKALPKRGISLETCRRYKYGVGQKFDGTPVQVASYGPGIQKLRDANKNFSWINKGETTFFGQELWHGGKRLVVTEGEIDCLSYAEAVECKWPVVSIPDGAGSAARVFKAQAEWIDSFNEIVLMFDMDEPGQAVIEDVMAVVTPGKLKVASLPRKDPNEVLMDIGSAALVTAVFQAKAMHPAGIVEGLDLIDDIMTPPEYGLSYPWTCLNDLTYGQRRKEMVTWIAGTGSGKSEILRAVSHHLTQVHGEKVGIVALEESNRRSAEGLLGYELGARLHVPEERERIGDDAIRAAAEKLLPSYIFYDHWGSIEAEVLLPKVRHMVRAMGVRWVVLDHLSIMVSGDADKGDERKRIDAITTALRTACSELGIGLHIVSHLRKASGTPHEEGGQISLQDIRGSGAPAQLSDFVIALERNQQAEDETERNTTKLRVLKNRLTGDTGVAGALHYDKATCRFSEVAVDVPVAFGDEEF